MIDEILRSSNRLGADDLERARRHAEEHGQELDEALAELGLIERAELARLLTELEGVPCLGGDGPPRFDPALASLVPAALARKLRVVPIERASKLLVLAAEDPRKSNVSDELERVTGLEIQLLGALPSTLRDGLIELYGEDPREVAVRALPPELRNCSQTALRLISQEVAERFQVLPVRVEGDTLVVAVVDAEDQRALRAVRFATEREVSAVSVDRQSLRAALTHYYGGQESTPAPAGQPTPEPATATVAPDAQAVEDEALSALDGLLDMAPDADLAGLEAPEPEPFEDEPAAAPAAPPPQAETEAEPEITPERVDATQLRSIPREVIALLSAETARNFTVIPVARRDKTLLVAMSGVEAKAVRALQYATGLLVQPVLAEIDEIRQAIVRYYPPRGYGGPQEQSEGLDPDVLDEVPDDVRELLKPEVARRYQAVPISLDGRRLTVAMVNPYDLAAIQDLEFVTGKSVTASRIEEELLEPYLDTFYVPEPEEEEEEAEEDGVIDDQVTEILEAADEEELENVEVVDDDEAVVQLSEAAASEVPAVRIVNMLIKEALRRGGSDIHLESYEGQFRARIRVDGILYEVGRPPKTLRDSIVSRIKVLAKLNISETRIPQDGRIKMRFKTAEGQVKSLDMRVSTTPTIWGEKVVIRVLDPDKLNLDLTKLGFEVEPLRRFGVALRKPYGMILVVGPSGCGKTNTLYSAMSVMNSVSTNIMTAEDPVEYNIKGLNQVPVLEATGLTFAACLRSFLRQDPNIILVGEIRDYETAEIAVKASLTGHLVLSTLHTQDAPATISRLINMGVEPFLVSNAVLLISAQRLVRRVCPECLEEDSVPGEELSELGFTDDEIKDLKPLKGAGCNLCNNTGYKGRTGLFEVLEITDPLRDVVMSGGTTLDIRRRALEQGMVTLRQAGLLKIKQGITTVEEVKRETIL